MRENKKREKVKPAYGYTHHQSRFRHHGFRHLNLKSGLTYPNFSSKLMAF